MNPHDPIGPVSRSPRSITCMSVLRRHGRYVCEALPKLCDKVPGFFPDSATNKIHYAERSKLRSRSSVLDSAKPQALLPPLPGFLSTLHQLFVKMLIQATYTYPSTMNHRWHPNKLCSHHILFTYPRTEMFDNVSSAIYTWDSIYY